MYGKLSEELLSKHEIVDPLEKMEPEDDFWDMPLCRQVHIDPFTVVSDNWRKQRKGWQGDKTIFDTPPELIETLREEFYFSRGEERGVPKDVLDNAWRILAYFLPNPAFALYYDSYCKDSDNFIHWLSAAPALKVFDAFGVSYNLRGGLEQTPRDDDHFWWSKNLTIMQYLRWRARVAAWVVEEQHQEMMESGQLSEHPQRICSLGAGGLPEFTMVNYQLDTGLQDVWAFDSDPQDDLLNYLRKQEKLSGIAYHREDLMSVLRSEQLHGKFNAVTMNGLMSYIPDQTRREVVMGAYALLAPGGVFGFDLQMEYHEMAWANSLFGWSERAPIYLSDSTEYVRKWAEGVATHLGMNCLVYPYPTAVPGETIGVYITMHKRADTPSDVASSTV